MTESNSFEKRWQRERTARKRAESLLESKASELYHLNQVLSQELTERTRGLYLSRKAIDLAGDGILMVRPDGSISYANETANRWLTGDAMNLAGESIFAFDGAFTREWWKREWVTLKALGSLTIETDIIGDHGFKRSIEATISHLDFSDEEYAIILARDISERARAEKERTRREEENRRLSLIAARTSNAVILTDRSGVIEWVNEGFVRMTGFLPEEARGHKPGELLQGPATDQSLVALMREKVQAGLGFEVEIENYRKDGVRYWVAIEAQPLTDADGNVQQFMAIESNITQRKNQMRREARLARLRTISSEILRLLLDDEAFAESMGKLLFEVGRFLSVSRARLQLVGSKGDLRADEWRNPERHVFRSPVDASRLLPVSLNREASSKLEVGDVEEWEGPATITSSLREAGVRAILALPIIHAGELDSIVVFEDLEAAHDWDPQEILQVWNTVQAFWLALERRDRGRLLELEAKAASQSAKHEIRTPMTAIVGYVDLLCRNPESVELRGEWADALRSNAKHLLSLVTDVLDLSKIEAGELEMKLERCRLDSLIGEALSIVRPRVREKLLALRAYASSPVPFEVDTDPVRLHQILVNLLVNAAKFTDRGSIEVSLSARVHEGRVILSIEVIDSGRGIDAKDLERVFEKFTQSDSHVSSTLGTGLGLPIARSLARMLGGDIEASSAIGRGSIFTVHIDAGVEAAVEWIEPLDFDPWSSGMGTTPDEDLEAGAGMRILVVDDNRENVRILRFLLADIGAEVGVAVDGREGVDAVFDAESRGRPYDVVLMDMSMPVLDGYGAARELRERGSQVHIIALTAFAMAGDEERCLEAGCNQYLTKPIMTDRLIGALKAVRRRSRPGPVENQAQTRASDFSSDPAMAKLVAEYASQFEGTALGIREAFETQDAQAISKIAHRLRGTALSYGFPAIGEAAARCEDSIRAGCPWPEAEAGAIALIDALERE
jgi:PAS domain S-box-containing protein